MTAPPTRILFDISKPSTILQQVGSSFDGVTEPGRAFADVGTADGVVRLAAPLLGSYYNDHVFAVHDVIPDGKVNTTARTTGGKPIIQVWPISGESAEQVGQRLNNANFDPRTIGNNDQEAARRLATTEGKPIYLIRAGVPSGGGTDPVTPGSAVMAGGDGAMNGNTYEVEADNGGLVIFDCDEPLVLKQVAIKLASSATWTLDLVAISGAYHADKIATIATATSDGAVLLNLPVTLFRPLGLAFTATGVGGLLGVTVQRG